MKYLKCWSVYFVVWPAKLWYILNNMDCSCETVTNIDNLVAIAYHVNLSTLVRSYMISTCNLLSGEIAPTKECKLERRNPHSIWKQEKTCRQSIWTWVSKLFCANCCQFAIWCQNTCWQCSIQYSETWGPHCKQSICHFLAIWSQRVHPIFVYFLDEKCYWFF